MIAEILEVKSGVRYKHAVGRLGRFVDKSEFTVVEFPPIDSDKGLRLILDLLGGFHCSLANLGFFRLRLGGVDIIYADIIQGQHLQVRVRVTINGVFKLSLGGEDSAAYLHIVARRDGKWRLEGHVL